MIDRIPPDPYRDRMYQYTYTETAETHGEDEDAEVRYQETVASELQEETDAALRAIEETRMAMEPIVCSCGSQRCYAISRFGLVRPLFVREIEPIGSQSQRDNLASQLVKAFSAI